VAKATKHFIRLVKELVAREALDIGKCPDSLSKLLSHGAGGDVEASPPRVNEDVLIEKLTEVRIETKESEDHCLNPEAVNEGDANVGIGTLGVELGDKGPNARLLRDKPVLTNLVHGSPILEELGMRGRTAGDVGGSGAFVANNVGSSGNNKSSRHSLGVTSIRFTRKRQNSSYISKLKFQFSRR